MTGLPTLVGTGDPASWCQEHADELRGVLRTDGAVLVRGLRMSGAEALVDVRAALALAPVPSEDEFAARDELADRVYSAPHWAADREMCLHHERSYSINLPGVLLMTALRRPTVGGRTLLSDTAAVLNRLPDRVVARFAEHGWLLVRTFRPYFGLSWATAFGTDDPERVESYCAEHAMSCEWQRDGTLRVAQVRPAVATGPDGAAGWFNQIAFFSAWSIDREEREVLLSSFGPDGLPFNTGYGDGEPLPEADFRAVLDAYDVTAVEHEWGADELLLIDNVRVAHGRTPYTGEREIAVAPVDPRRLADLAPDGPLTAGGTLR